MTSRWCSTIVKEGVVVELVVERGVQSEEFLSGDVPGDGGEFGDVFGDGVGPEVLASDVQSGVGIVAKVACYETAGGGGDPRDLVLVIPDLEDV
jgi:hypothetical protein